MENRELTKMLRNNFLLLLLVIGLVGVSASSGTTRDTTNSTKPSDVHGHSQIVVCYWGTWAHYHYGKGRYKLWNNFNPDLCTHLVYAFVGVSNETYGINILDPRLDMNAMLEATNLK